MNQLIHLFTPHIALAVDWTTANNCISSQGVATITGFNCLFANVAEIVVYVAGMALFFMLIKGGFTYLTSGGDPKKTAKATHTLSMSVIGLIGVILAYLIIQFISSFTGITKIKYFNLPNSSGTTSGSTPTYTCVSGGGICKSDYSACTSSGGSPTNGTCASGVCCALYTCVSGGGVCKSDYSACTSSGGSPTNGSCSSGICCSK